MDRNDQNRDQSINLKIRNRYSLIDITQISGRFTSKILDGCKFGVFGEERT
jgi:hypothetical protein